MPAARERNSPLSRGPGRPPKGDVHPTRLVRVRTDLADMLGWIARLEDVRVSDVLDELIRAPIATRFGRYADAVGTLKALAGGRKK